ncbi:MAG: 50S ribosomal protein L7/L12 [candidate division Zixibacteria bacterium]|nr:50S ribosomal protein L7/L12 [candidate division Zixibacteria bacterium]
MSSTIDQVVGIIEGMSVMELSQLSKTLQDKFGVSAAAPVAVMAGGGGGGAAAVEEQKTEFTPHLTVVGEKKINVIKVIREITGLGLKEAKDLVDNAPNPVKENVSKEEAQAIQTKLREVGATVEIK